MAEEPKIILFGPKSGKALTGLYPEIASHPKLKTLSLPSEDMLFAWYMGCESSPIDPEWTDKIRRTSAALSAIKDERKRKEYGEGNIPVKVKEAIEVFKTFSPDARMKAKRMVQTIMHKWEEMVDVDVATEFLITKRDKEGNETVEVDWTGRKQYIDSTAKISDSLPSLLAQLESGFGIKEKEQEQGKKMIDKFHQEKRE